MPDETTNIINHGSVVICRELDSLFTCGLVSNPDKHQVYTVSVCVYNIQYYASQTPGAAAVNQWLGLVSKTQPV